MVYQLVKSVFENIERFQRLHPAFKDLKPEEMIEVGLSAPLHEGAERYYRNAAGCKVGQAASSAGLIATPQLRTRAPYGHGFSRFRYLKNRPHFMQDKQLSTEELIARDVGARSPAGPMAAVIAGLALLWSLFQLWIASPLPFILGFGVLNDTETRSIHLAFALLLAFLAYPAFKRSPRDRVPLMDIALGLVAAACAAYLFLAYSQLAQRPGNLTTLDLVTACVGIPLLLEATRRALGPPLAIIALVFLVYSVAGPWMPGLLAHRGVSFTALANHRWITTEGVFGIALGVSTSFVFLFVLFGALLERAGAGHYFIQLAFSMLGHFRGGPAKAAVVASGMTGLISGSSIANVVTTGTFTIPMMKRTGFSAERPARWKWPPRSTARSCRR